MNLLSKSEIVSLPEPNIPVSGVYFLISEGEIVYVGRSINVPSRVNAHLKKGKIKFDAWRMIHCKIEELDDIESSYIMLIRPPLNRDDASLAARNESKLPGVARAVTTPKGSFPSVYAASKAHGITPNLVDYRIQIGKPGWHLTGAINHPFAWDRNSSLVQLPNRNLRPWQRVV